MTGTLRTAVTASALLLGAYSSNAQAQDESHKHGPAPAWETFRQQGEAAITARLIDPESARINWLGGYMKGGFKPFLEGRVRGYVACGTVNARNRMGGYTGASTFVVVIDYDRVIYSEIDKRAGGMISEQCGSALRSGLLPPLAAAQPTTGASTTQGAASGLTLRSMPDGAYVSAVVADSPAALAGLKPGMVIASVNAIPLQGMGDAMLKVLDAAGASAELTIIGGKALKLGSTQ
ncbi:PDZ domain-containing protein [Sphingomonas sp. M1-B02]|uniref:PDZ domain-containing protein n=1 Tax=Sphingomonas sp. M1-B02 TaxID=3114300 RepID=UPI00223FF03C|nr:PDZ domain-containing protein [Sphingomonas sp. S6-11]UZK67334.1 PDZ domain-containing protein [Sphingomonas sp. S6-11]